MSSTTTTTTTTNTRKNVIFLSPYFSHPSIHLMALLFGPWPPSHDPSRKPPVSPSAPPSSSPLLLLFYCRTTRVVSKRDGPSVQRKKRGEEIGDSFIYSLFSLRLLVHVLYVEEGRKIKKYKYQYFFKNPFSAF